MSDTRIVLMTAALLLAVPSASFGQAVEIEPGSILAISRDEAIKRVVASTRSKDKFLRANAVEAAQHLPERLVPIVQLAMEDEAAVVRFSAYAAAGKTARRDLAPLLERRVETERQRMNAVGAEIVNQGPGMSDTHRRRAAARWSQAQSVYAAALAAAHRCGCDMDLSPLADLLARKDARLRANVAMMLGMIGDPGAVPMMRQLARVPMPRESPVAVRLTRMQMAEAMVRLGDDQELDTIRAGAYSTIDEVRVLCVTILGRLNDRRMAPGLALMLEQPPIELQTAAAEALARMGRDDGLQVALTAAQFEFPAVRAQAAIGLPYFDNEAAAKRLVEMLDDPSEQVRLTAAGSILSALANEQADADHAGAQAQAPPVE